MQAVHRFAAGSFFAGTMIRRGAFSALWPWAACFLVAMALLLRFVMLGERPVMHDESLFAWYAYGYFDSGRYTHQPILHGPTMLLAGGALFGMFGDSIAVARGFIAGASLLMLAAALVLVPRRYRFAFAPLLITSPVLLYYSRFFRDDILFSAVLMMGIVGFSLALSPRRGAGVRAAGAALGVFMFLALAGIMENAVFVYATGATFLLLLAARRRGWLGWPQWHGDAARRIHAGSGTRSAIPRRGWIVGAGWTAGLLLGLAYLAFVYGITLAPIYQDMARRAVVGDAPEKLSAIFLGKLELNLYEQANFMVRLMADSWRNVRDSLDYWMGQHKLNRISGPSHYYLPILLIYELPIVLMLLAGLAWDACRRDARLPWRRAVVYGAAAATWVGLWLLWRLVSRTVAPAWLIGMEKFLHLNPDASALTLGFVITPVLVWSVLSLRENRVLAAWMGWWLACSLFQYSCAGEKVPWLAIHITLPLYLTVVWLWAPRLRRFGRMGTAVAVGVVVAASALALRNDVPLIGSRSADPGERILYNQTTPWLHQALEARVALWKTMQDKVPLKQRRVLMAGHGVWPAIWYVRHFSYQIVDESQKLPGVPEGTDLVIGTPEQLASLQEGVQAGRFIAHAGSLRAGWIETWPGSIDGTTGLPTEESSLDSLKSGMAKWWRYYWTRELWSQRSGFPILLVEPVMARH